MKHIPLLPFCGKTLVLLATLNLTGCGLTQMVSDGTRSAANAIFYKQVKIVHLDFVAREALNTDDTGASLSTIIRVYQLKDSESFDESDYASLFAKIAKCLSLPS